MIRLLFVGLSSLVLLSACASSTFKARQEQRDKLASSAGMYCEFVNGEKHPDVDVELNMQMANRCDSGGTFSITNYRNSSEQNGVIYCCSIKASEPKSMEKKSTASSRKKSESAMDAELDATTPDASKGK